MAEPRGIGESARVGRDAASLALLAYFAGLIVLVVALLGLQALP
jgi:hypothetical protein